MWATNKIRAVRMCTITLDLHKPTTDLQLVSSCGFFTLKLFFELLDASCQLLAMCPEGGSGSGSGSGSW